jgi:hypothetical protein
MMLTGAQTPRIMSVPKYHRTSGQDVVELAEMAGLYLDPWQQLVIEHMFGEQENGKSSAFEVAVIVARQNGKGSILEAAELGWLFLTKEPLIVHTAHEVKTSDEAFLRIKNLIDGCPALKKRCHEHRNSNGQQAIRTLAGSRLRFLARSQGSGRGFTTNKLVFDEAFDLDERHMSALMPTISAVPDPQVIYMSSAPRAEDEVLNALCDRGQAGTSPKLAYFEWSADPKASLDDRNGWAQSNPALGFRLTEETVERMRESMPAASFAREALSIRPDPGAGGVIPGEVWDALADPDSAVQGQIAFAVDTSPDRRWTSISSAGQNADGKQHVELVDHMPGTRWVTERLLELRDRHQPCAIVLDAGAAAGSLLPELIDAGIEALIPTMRQVGQACGAFYDAAMGGMDESGESTDAVLRHIGQEPLDDAVRGAKKRPLGDAWAWDRKNSSIDITPLVSSTLALWGWATKHNDDDSGGWMVIL